MICYVVVLDVRLLDDLVQLVDVLLTAIHNCHDGSIPVQHLYTDNIVNVVNIVEPEKTLCQEYGD